MELFQRRVGYGRLFSFYDDLFKVASEVVHPEVVKISDEIEQENDWTEWNEKQYVQNPVTAVSKATQSSNLVKNTYDPSYRDQNDANNDKRYKKDEHEHGVLNHHQSIVEPHKSLASISQSPGDGEHWNLDQVDYWHC